MIRTLQIATHGYHSLDRAGEPSTRSRRTPTRRKRRGRECSRNIDSRGSCRTTIKNRCDRVGGLGRDGSLRMTISSLRLSALVGRALPSLAIYRQKHCDRRQQRNPSNITYGRSTCHSTRSRARRARCRRSGDQPRTRSVNRRHSVNTALDRPGRSCLEARTIRRKRSSNRDEGRPETRHCAVAIMCSTTTRTSRGDAVGSIPSPSFEIRA